MAPTALHPGSLGARRLPLLLGALLAACNRGPSPGSLQKAFEAVPRSPLCARSVPEEWVSSWPVPTAAPGQYKVMFYALDRTAQDPSGLPRVRPTQPRGEAVFSTNGKVLACGVAKLDPKPLDSERYGAAVMELDEEGFDKASSRLLSLTETIAAAYAAKRPADPKAAAAYFKQFQLMAEPHMNSFYYKANPDFWEWLRGQAGQSLSVPNM